MHVKYGLFTLLSLLINILSMSSFMSSSFGEISILLSATTYHKTELSDSFDGMGFESKKMYQFSNHSLVNFQILIFGVCYRNISI